MNITDVLEGAQSINVEIKKSSNIKKPNRTRTLETLLVPHSCFFRGNLVLILRPACVCSLSVWDPMVHIFVCGSDFYNSVLCLRGYLSCYIWLGFLNFHCCLVFPCMKGAPSCIDSAVHGHFFCFQFWAIRNNGSMSIFVHTY